MELRCRLATSEEFLLILASNIGATVTPWMLFFQQSASVDKGLTPKDIPQGRLDTLIGTVLAALAGGAALVAASTLFDHHVDTSTFQAGAGYAEALRPLIVSRANLLHALASASANIPSGTPTDAAICDQLITELAKQPWSPQLNATVRDGVVDLWGVVLAAHQREAAMVAAENIPGVKAVRSHVAWVEPVSGMVIYDPEQNAGGTAATTGLQ